MENTPQTAAPNGAIDDLYTLVLADGLATTREGRELRYKVVKLRETTVADERAAQRLSERVVLVDGVHKLLQSDGDFRFALTMRHIESLHCDSLVIPQAALDLDLLGRLTPHDFGLIEQRIVLITVAAQVRYGVITQADFDTYANGQTPQGVAHASPQPSGQTAGVGAHGVGAESGPALLADYLGGAAQGAAAGAGA